MRSKTQLSPTDREVNENAPSWMSGQKDSIMKVLQATDSIGDEYRQKIQ
jgi:hypothetical protein